MARNAHQDSGSSPPRNGWLRPSAGKKTGISPSGFSIPSDGPPFEDVVSRLGRRSRVGEHADLMHTPMNDQIESQKGLSQPGKFREPDSLPAFAPPSGAPSKRKWVGVAFLCVLLALAVLWVAKTRWAAAAKKPAANARAEAFP